MIIYPHTIALITTDKCTASCKDCCFECSPEKNSYIPYSKMKEIIHDAAKINSVKNIVFTGGECFTLGGKLIKLINEANENNFNTRVITNGYWAKSESHVTKKCSELVDAGLREINFSTGRSHAEFVPVENIIRGAKVSASSGLSTVINIENHVGYCDTEIINSIKKDEEVLKLEREGKIKIIHSHWVAKENEKHKSNNQNQQKKGCKTIMNVLAVTPSLSLVPCCGLKLEAIPDIHIGNLTKKSMMELISSKEDDLMKIMLNIYGPEELISKAKDLDHSIQTPNHFVHPCEYCQYIYKDNKIKAALLKLSKSKEAEILSIFFAGYASKSILADLQ